MGALLKREQGNNSNESFLVTIPVWIIDPQFKLLGDIGVKKGLSSTFCSLLLLWPVLFWEGFRHFCRSCLNLMRCYSIKHNHQNYFYREIVFSYTNSNWLTYWVQENAEWIFPPSLTTSTIFKAVNQNIVWNKQAIKSQ